MVKQLPIQRNSSSDPEKKPVHNYYAEAHVLSAELEQPLQETITAPCRM